MNRLVLPISLFAAATAPLTFAAITITSPTTAWTTIAYPNPTQADPGSDLQTGGIDGDFVGNATHASLYSIFDDAGTPSLTDGEIAFRVRVAGDKSPSGLSSDIWVGIDGNADGKIDLFAAVVSGTNIGFYKPGGGLNTSPNTTTIDTTVNYGQVAVSATNFSFARVTNGVAGNDPGATNLNLDGGSGGSADHNDYFVSFKLSLSSMIAGMTAAGIASFDQNTNLRYVVASSTNGNTLNQDINGISFSGDVNSTTSWTALGGFTQTYSPAGVVPEPSSVLLLSVTSLLLGIRRRKLGA